VSVFNRHCGVEVDELSRRQVKESFPVAKVADIEAGFYVKADGRVNAADVTMALAKGARMRGVKIFVLCVRITYVGELGYELYIPAEQERAMGGGYGREVVSGSCSARPCMRVGRPRRGVDRASHWRLALCCGWFPAYCVFSPFLAIRQRRAQPLPRATADLRFPASSGADCVAGEMAFRFAHVLETKAPRSTAGAGEWPLPAI
jgi:hypothetical protein